MASRQTARHDGRVALVTGAASGLGREYAIQLGADGAAVIAVDLVDASETAAAIVAAGGTAQALMCDVSDPDEVSATARAAASLGTVDILVNNAGIYPRNPVADITSQEWRRVIATNLDSVFLVTAAVLPGMRRQGWGRVICVASGMFHAGLPGSLHYVASKGGVIGFVRALASEVGADGVTVNAVAPGLIRTDGTSTGEHDELGLFDAVIAAQAVKRTGMPADLAPAVSFLASEGAGFITGQTLLVDGGVARA